MQTSERLQLLPQYRDTTIVMEARRGQHWYRVGGHEALLPSVTTFLKVIDKSGPLVGWARKDALEKAAAELRAQLQIAVPWRDEDQGPWVADVMAGAKDRIYRTKDSAADAGADAHELIAAILQGGSPLVPDALRPAVQGAQEMLADYRLSPVAIEHLVWHPSQQYAGTIDLVARDADGRLVVVDWKRAKGIYPEHGYQVAAYADAIEALTDEPVVGAYVVRLPQNGQGDLRYEVRAVDDRAQAQAIYRLALGLWWALKEPIWSP